jgi:RNA polymerase-binding transcription factor DksA
MRNVEPLADRARRTLATRRRSLEDRLRVADDDTHALLDEREPDWEDRAANVAAADVIQRIGESEHTQLALVNGALARLEAGTWGTCLDCGADIAANRLRRVPEATRCRKCIPA